MQTIGERLEEARKRKGVSIREAADATKIRGEYLQKLESNSFNLNLPDIYVRGFLRSYASYLKLPAAEKITADYNAIAGAEKKTPRRERDMREIYGRMELADTGSPISPKPAAGDVAGDSDGGPAASANERPVSRAPRLPDHPAIDQVMLIKGGIILGGTLLVILIVVLVVKAVFHHSSAAAVAAASPPPAAVQAEAAQTLNLIGLDSTRVKVVQELDGKILFSGSLARGETRSFQKQGKLLITVEIGRNLRLEVNNRGYPVPIDGYGRFGVD
jgi:transcriptional regulator with XRE-family HTH domain